MKKTVLAISLLISTAFLTPTMATAHADDCVGSFTVGIGGFTINGGGTGQDSGYMVNVDQRVGYNSGDPQGGLNELDRLIQNHRWACPDDHIKIIGHSEGAGIVHAWVTANQDFGNANAILLADPKRAGNPGGPGLSASGGVLGYPLAGTDDWFGDFPTLTICNSDDQICDTDAGWWGYFTGAHQRYDFDVTDYGDWGSGVWLR